MSVQPFSMLADVAQLVEHGIRNTGVMGSTPIVGSIREPWFSAKVFLFVASGCGIVRFIRLTLERDHYA